ncbi:MAG: hypothetical protein NXH95_04715 [Pseudomonadaceae bacterium]|nr:hypothetical protein [Pseudomonadaceae bacterium]
MAIRLTKPWIPLEEGIAGLRGHLGVFQLADAQQQIVYIGFAGGNSLFGLRGEVTAMSKEIADSAFVRVEITTAYLSRYRELMMIHIADHGILPSANKLNKQPLTLGKMSPAG